MSNKHITLAFKADLSPTMKLTLIAVCDSVDEDGTWKLRYETIAEKTSQSRRAVMGHVKSLSEMGVISTQKTRREDGRQGANIFTVNIDRLAQIQSADIDKSQSADSVISETQSADGDNSRVQMTSFQSAANDTPITPSYPQSLPPVTPRSPPVDDFERLWGAWEPFDMRKGDKQISRKSWDKHVAKPGIDPAMVIAQARAYCADARRHGSKTKHVQTWLNNGGWQEDYGPPMSNSDMVEAALHEKWRREDGSDESGNLRTRTETPAGRIHAPAQPG